MDNKPSRRPAVAGLPPPAHRPRGLEARLAAGPLTGYCGFDPTAPSLHLGNLMQLMLWRRLQEAGHKPLLLVGGATCLIGDPKAAGERTLNSREVVAEWSERLTQQVSRFVSFEDSAAAKVVNKPHLVRGVEHGGLPSGGGQALLCE